MITLLLATVWSMGGYAQETVTDELTATSLKLTSSYSKFSNITLTSDAVYSGAGYVGTGKNNYGIQIKSKIHNNNFYTGIVSSTSGGKIKTITIDFNKKCDGVNVYGKNTAYESADDLFNSSKKGDLIQEVLYSSSEVVLTPKSDYKYVGFCSKSGAVYIDKITIVWEQESSSSDKTNTTLSFPQSSYTFATTDDLSSFKGQTATLTAGDTELTDKSISYTKDDTNKVISTLNEDGTLVLSGNAGTAKVTASFGGDNEYASSTASYTISVKPVVKDIATLKPQITSTDTKNPQSFTLKLTDAVVTYVNKNTAYVQDATAGIYVYASGHNLENNQKINGLVDIGTCLFNGLPEIVSWTLASDAVVTENATFDIETVTLAELTANYSKYESKPVKVAGAVVTKAFADNSGEISQDGTTYVVYNKGGSGVTLTEGDNIDIIGYPAIFNGTKQLYLWKQSNVTVNYSQVATTISFNPATTEYTVEKGKESAFTAPTVTVKDADDNVVEGAKITYKSSNTDVATVDTETGNVTFGSEFGTTTITASYAGDATHKAAKDISYTIIYGKVKTTMAWSKTEVNANIGQDFTAPTLTLTADGESILDGETIIYTSSEPTVAEISETGAVTIKGIEGKATITATFAGDDTYAENSAQYTLTVVDPNKMEVTFDFTDPSKYGYGTTSGSPAFGEGAGDIKEGLSISEGLVTLTNTKVYNSGTRFYSDGLRIYEGNVHTLSVPAGYRITSVAFTGASKYTIENGTENSSWTGNKRNVVISYTDTNKKVTALTVNYKKADLPSISLDENDNDIVVLENENKDVNVNINRTMSADGGWYTFCVPFDVADVSITPLKDAEVRQYDSMVGSVMNFKATTSLKAAHAYLVKPTADIVNPVFNDVTVSLGDSEKDGYDGYEFVGIYSEVKLKTDGTNLFLGAGNKFYVPTSDDCTLKALRGYFVAPSADSGAKMSIDIDGNTTSISSLNSGKVILNGNVYNLNGQYVGKDVKTLQKGIYMVNGKKYIVK